MKEKYPRHFYIKKSGNYLSGRSEYLLVWSLSKEEAIKFTDTEYDSIKHKLPNNHTLELVINPNIYTQ